MYSQMKGQWTKVYSDAFPLRSWWVDSGSECEYASIVLLEILCLLGYLINIARIKKYPIP